MSLRDWPILRQLCPNFLATVRIAFVFGQTGREALMTTGDDKVYGVGDNSANCLGTGNASAAPLPFLNSVLSGKNVDGFTCGGTSNGMFVIARLQNGDIYQWGLLPTTSNNTNQPIPKRVEFNVEIQVKVKSVACGSSHCMIVSDDGRVFTWGRNDKGQLGRDTSQSVQSVTNTPCQVGGAIKGKVVTEISCGAEFSFAILEDRKVFSWGSNMNGQLGISNNKVPTSSVPVAVLIPENVIIEKIACGSSHVLALSKNQELYVWGNNNCSQLGGSAPKQGITYVKRLAFGSNLKFVDICASYLCDLSVAQSQSGEIYIWGKTATGQIINEPTDSQCESIHQVFASYASPNVMPKPLRQILEAKRRTTSKSLESEFGNQENSDLTILVDNREIYVHQAILKMRSTYFKSMLPQENQRVITIEEKSYPILEAYLKYLYTDKLEVDLELAVELLQLADEYADENFKLLCERSIKRDVTADKVADLFALTRQPETCQAIKELNNFFLDYALKHAEKMTNSEGFMKWDIDTLREFTIELAKMKKTAILTTTPTAKPPAAVQTPATVQTAILTSSRYGMLQPQIQMPYQQQYPCFMPQSSPNITPIVRGL